jgi:prepilin-type N-terminal cleavage/methylation domain-containing protein
MVTEKRGNSQGGFSLVEMMLAIVLSAVVLAVGTAILTLGNQISYRTESLLASNSVAFAKIQEYENKTFTNITIGDVANDYEIEDFSAQVPASTNNVVKNATAKVYSQYAPNSQSLVKLWVIVDFQYGNRTRIIEYATYIQMGGVGR